MDTRNEVWKRVRKRVRKRGEKRVRERVPQNDIFGSEIGPRFGVPGRTHPPTILRGTPRIFYIFQKESLTLLWHRWLSRCIFNYDFSEYALLRVLLVACLDNCLVLLTQSKQRFLKHNTEDLFTSPQSVAPVTNTSLFLKYNALTSPLTAASHHALFTRT